MNRMNILKSAIVTCTLAGFVSANSANNLFAHADDGNFGTCDRQVG